MNESTQLFFAHSSACIDDGAVVGKGSKIWHYSHIMAGAQIGLNATIGQNVVISPACKLGDNIKVQNNVSIYTGVTLEDDVFCGPSMVFTNVINPRSFIERKHEFRPTLVERGASIGANATIICGCTLGTYCMIGAGTVVTKDVPAYGLIVGNPGRLVGYVCYCGERLKLANTGFATEFLGSDSSAASDLHEGVERIASEKSPQKLQCNACDRFYELTGLELTMMDL